MAVQNSLARQRKPEAKPQTTTYMANGQQVELSPEIVKKMCIRDRLQPVDAYGEVC